MGFIHLITQEKGLPFIYTFSTYLLLHNNESRLRINNGLLSGYEQLRRGALMTPTRLMDKSMKHG